MKSKTCHLYSIGLHVIDVHKASIIQLVRRQCLKIARLIFAVLLSQTIRRSFGDESAKLRESDIDQQ